MPGILSEPPFRTFTAALMKRLSRSIRTHEWWDTSERPQYLTGILRGAEQALREGTGKMSVVEFGVASGQGLLAMQRLAAAVQSETGVEIDVYGFDTGAGLTPPSGGYRDHPDKWIQGDFPTPDMAGLRAKLSPSTHLILGNVEETVPKFVNETQQHPIGFVSFDLDYYSSTVHAMKIFSLPKRNHLIHTPLYFDDTLFFEASEYSGERLAIREFNEQDHPVKIDSCTVLRFGRPFHDRQWLSAMYVANDMQRMGQVNPAARGPRVLPM
jgi:hypothetical protein